MLEVRELGHAYPDGHVALHDLSLKVAGGELVSIVGPSGCGFSFRLWVMGRSRRTRQRATR